MIYIWVYEGTNSYVNTVSLDICCLLMFSTNYNSIFLSTCCLLGTHTCLALSNFSALESLGTYYLSDSTPIATRHFIHIILDINLANRLSVLTLNCQNHSKINNLPLWHQCQKHLTIHDVSDSLKYNTTIVWHIYKTSKFVQNLFKILWRTIYLKIL